MNFSGTEQAACIAWELMLGNGLSERLSARATVRMEPATATTIIDVRSVVLCVELNGVSDESVLTVEFWGPGGRGLYNRKSTILPGAPQGVQLVSFRLPVAGTYIETARMFGIWSARFFVGSKEVAQQQFVLQPCQ